MQKSTHIPSNVCTSMNFHIPNTPLLYPTQIKRQNIINTQEPHHAFQLLPVLTVNNTDLVLPVFVLDIYKIIKYAFFCVWLPYSTLYLRDSSILLHVVVDDSFYSIL